MAHHPEVILVSSVIQTGHIDAVEEAGLRADHFHAYRPVWEWLEHYVMRYRKVPGKSVFRKSHPDFPLLRSTDVDWAIEEVKRNHLKQSLATVVNEAVDCFKRDEYEDALAALAPTVSRLERDFDSGRTLDVSDDAEDIFRLVAERATAADEHGFPGVPTGFQTLDEVTGGIQPGQYWVLAARLKNGKSWVATRMAVEAALAGKRVLFHSLEMGRHQVALRTHTFYGRMHKKDFTNRQLNTGMGLDLVEYQDFLESMPASVPGSVKIIDRSRSKVSPFSIAANIERYEPDLVFVDYIQLMASGGKKDDWVNLSEISGDLQSIAQESGVPLVALSQINREGSHGRTPPSADNLARSDSIGQDVDGLITLKQHTKRTLQMRLAAYRHGVSGQMFWNIFDPDHGRIEECTYEDAMDFQADDEADEEED